MPAVHSKHFSGNSHVATKSATKSDLATILRALLDDGRAAREGYRDALGHHGGIHGCYVSDPTTPSSQAAGVGNTSWLYNRAPGVVEVNAVRLDAAIAADAVIHAGSLLTGFVDGTSCIAAVVAKNVAGTVTIVAVKGTPAATDTQVAPTDAEIQAAVGAANTWCKLAECTLKRTGDAAVTETQDNTKADILGSLGSLGSVTKY